MKCIVVLGSTGSIGTQTLEVARWRGYHVIGLAAGHQGERLLEQAHEFHPELVSCDESVVEEVRAGLPRGTRLVTGLEGAEEIAGLEADVVVAAIPGIRGLGPTVAAMRSGARVALAHKEAMVIAGPLVWALAKEHGTEVVPVDSEHSALYQCLSGEPEGAVHSLVLTASGGPFRLEPDDLSKVTPEEALQHPTWAMGPRVTIDSATLFNKGLEVLEAHSLFGIPLERIEVLVHPQSLVHSFVRFTDGSLKAHVGPHDMRLPIQYGIEAPERPEVPLEPLPLNGTWTFFEVNGERFPSLELAYEAGRLGGVAPAALNAADEVAVEAFLARKIRFTDISRVLAGVLARTQPRELSWEAVERADREARGLAEELIETFRPG